MEKNTPQKVWMQLTQGLFCGNCKVMRLMIWEKESHSDLPRQAKTIEEFWYAVHCDYFKQRVEHPDKLKRCAAFQAKPNL